MLYIYTPNLGFKIGGSEFGKGSRADLESAANTSFYIMYRIVQLWVGLICKHRSHL